MSKDKLFKNFLKKKKESKKKPKELTEYEKHKMKIDAFNKMYEAFRKE